MLTKIITDAREIEQLHADWNRLLLTQTDSVDGLDGTSSYEWHSSIADTFPEASSPSIAVAKEGDEIRGILPVISSRMGASNAFARIISMPTDIYGGRNGPIAENNSPEIARRLFETVLDGLGWDVANFTLPAGGVSELALHEACAERRLKIHIQAVHESPYFSIPQSSELLRKSLHRSTRSRTVKGEEALRKMGILEFCTHTTPKEVDSFVESVMQIERGSWKEKTGTSITCHPRQERFYRQLLPRLAQSDMLCTMLVRLDDRPIAYRFGVRTGKVFIDLKNSLIEEFEKHSVGHICHIATLESLIGKGVETYDWMGLVEPHKMRWPEAAVYKRNQYVLFNNTIAGQIGRFRLAASAWGRRLKPNKNDVPDAEKSE